MRELLCVWRRQVFELPNVTSNITMVEEITTMIFWLLPALRPWPSPSCQTGTSHWTYWNILKHFVLSMCSRTGLAPSCPGYASPWYWKVVLTKSWFYWGWNVLASQSLTWEPANEQFAVHGETGRNQAWKLPTLWRPGNCCLLIFFWSPLWYYRNMQKQKGI